MKYIKRISSFLLSLLICVCMIFENQIRVFANEKADIINQEYEETIAYYNAEIIKSDSDGNNKRSSELRYELARKLTSAGYTAYYVNSSNYYDLEKLIKTDFEDLGVCYNDNCVLIIGDSDYELNASSSGFYYSYNGAVYNLRNITITAADNSDYGMASSVNVLQTNSRTFIENCLNAAIYAYIGGISNALGAVATICGLDISKFNTSQASTMYLNAGTNWTRKYTQVWSSYDNMWLNGSSVEMVVGSAYMSGMYYSSSENRYVAVPTNASSVTYYSANYSNSTWRYQKAVLGYISGIVNYDVTGDVKYYYNSTLKVRHNEPY